MRKLLSLALSAGIALSVGQANVVAKDGHGSLIVKISKLKNDKGNVRVAVYNTQDSYDAEKGSGDSQKACAKAVAEIKTNEAQCTIEDLAYGDYALKFFHDEDKSGKFYKNFLGIPKVEYGFSNNAKGRFGPASFEQAKFKLDKPSMAMNLEAQ